MNSRVFVAEAVVSALTEVRALRKKSSCENRITIKIGKLCSSSFRLQD